MGMSKYESQRLEALRRLDILHSPVNQRLDTLTRLAKTHYGVQAAMFSLVDEEHLWVKSPHENDATEVPRDIVFCDHTIRQDKILIVEDATEDCRFCDNPFVNGEANTRFYAGIPVRESSGFKIGVLCIVDDKPRRVNEGELDVLRVLAGLIEEEIERAYVTQASCEFVGASRLGRSIQRAQNVFLNDDGESGAFEVILNDLLVLTGSQFGFIGDTLYKENGDPYLKIRAITNIAWSPETQALHREIESRGMIFERLDNLLGEALVTEEIVVANDVDTDCHRGIHPFRPMWASPFSQPISSLVWLAWQTGTRVTAKSWRANWDHCCRPSGS